MSAALLCFTHHFIINFMEVNFANFINNVFTLKRDKTKTCGTGSK